MPNGYEPDMMLTTICGAYHFRYGEWPERLEVTPHFLWAFAKRLDLENFERLAERLEIQVVEQRMHVDPSTGSSYLNSMVVSGDAGVFSWHEGAPELPTHEEVLAWVRCYDEAVGWLGIEPLEPGYG